MSDAIKHITDDIFFRKTEHWCTCIVRAMQSTAAALSTFS